MLVVQEILDHMITHPFTVMTFEEASQLLKDKASSIVEPGKGLSREQELIIVEKLNGNRPVFVIDWPSDIKPFYMRECDYDPTKVSWWDACKSNFFQKSIFLNFNINFLQYFLQVSAVDLLVPTVGELCGGSLREANVEKLTSKLNVMDPTGKLLESLSWYLDLRKYGGTPTGGYGMGFDRLLQLVTGIGNIKDVNPFPRWAHHCPM